MNKLMILSNKAEEVPPCASYPSTYSELYRETLSALRSADLSADQYLELKASLEEGLRYAADDLERILICQSLLEDLATTHNDG
jgi:hypothetical protein